MNVIVAPVIKQIPHGLLPPSGPASAGLRGRTYSRQRRVSRLDTGKTASREEPAEKWFALAEQLTGTDSIGAEEAYWKVLELASSPHYHAYTNLAVSLRELESRCDDALSIFDGHLNTFGMTHCFTSTERPFSRNCNGATAAAYQRC